MGYLYLYWYHVVLLRVQTHGTVSSLRRDRERQEAWSYEFDNVAHGRWLHGGRAGGMMKWRRAATREPTSRTLDRAAAAARNTIIHGILILVNRLPVVDRCSGRGFTTRTRVNLYQCPLTY